MKPIFKILANGADITEHIKKNLVSLSIRDARGVEADSLTLIVTDPLNKLAWPKPNITLKVWLGYKPPKSDKKLYYKGLFIVDEVEHSGPPDIFTIRARGSELLAEQSEKMKLQKTFSWHEPDTHLWLGDIITKIAISHGLEPKVAKKFFTKKIKHIDQTVESDFHFVTRLAERYDATSKINNKALVFLEKGKAQTASGAPMPEIHIDRTMTDTHRYNIKGRPDYTGVKAHYHSNKKAKLLDVVVGSGPKIKTLKRNYPNKIQAQDAAQTALDDLTRDTKTLELSLAHGMPQIGAEYRIFLSGWRKEIDKEWVSTEVNHQLTGDAGLSTRLQMELPQK